MKIMKLSSLALISGLTLSASAFSGGMGPVVMDPSYFEILAGGGIAEILTSHGSLAVTRSETDRLISKDRWDAGTYQVGVGYVRPFNSIVDGQSGWFSSYAAQVNVYGIHGDVKGPIHRFGNPAFHDYNYKMDLDSTRLMFDGLVDVFGFSQFSVYGKAGIGAAWNDVKYRESAIGVRGGCPSNAISLNSKDNTEFAWEAGAGVKYRVTPALGLSFEYLYSDLGKVNSNNRRLSPCLYGVGPRGIDLAANSLLLKLHWAFV